MLFKKKKKKKFVTPSNWIPQFGGYNLVASFSTSAIFNANNFSSHFSCAMISGNPSAVFYSARQLMFAAGQSSDGAGGFTISVIAGDGDSGSWPSLLANVQGRPAVAFGQNGAVVYMRASSASGVGAWEAAPAPVTVINGTFSPTNQTTVINGDLVLTNNSALVLNNQQQQIVVTGQAVLGGSLTVSVSSSGTFTVLTAQGVSGSFSNVAVSSSSCSNATVTPSYGTLSVLVTVGGCSSSLSSGAIAGIAIGCCAAAAAIIVIGVFAFLHVRKSHDSRKNSAISKKNLSEIQIG